MLSSIGFHWAQQWRPFQVAADCCGPKWRIIGATCDYPANPRLRWQPLVNLLLSVAPHIVLLNASRCIVTVYTQSHPVQSDWDANSAHCRRPLRNARDSGRLSAPSPFCFMTLMILILSFDECMWMGSRSKCISRSTGGNWPRHTGHGGTLNEHVARRCKWKRR